jgi:lysyl-tRNA synthetase class II
MAMSIQQMSEQEQLRREKLAELIMMGIEPYPAALYPVSHDSAYIKKNYSEDRKEEFADVCVAGRIMSVRDMGKQILPSSRILMGKYNYTSKEMTSVPETIKACLILSGKNYWISATSLAYEDLCSLPKRVKLRFMLKN